jgi:hypothetical protein
LLSVVTNLVELLVDFIQNNMNMDRFLVCNMSFYIFKLFNILSE